MLTVITLALMMEKTMLPNPEYSLPGVNLYRVAEATGEVRSVGRYVSLKACEMALTERLQKSPNMPVGKEAEANLLCINWQKVASHK